MVLTALPTEAAEHPGAALCPGAEGPQLRLLSLQVSGGKPLRLRAVPIAEGNSWCLGTQAWHEVRLLRRDTGEIAVSITCFKKVEGDADIFSAELFPTMDEAATFLEQFDPTADLRCDIDAADRSVSAAQIALRAATLRQRSDDICRQWRALIGEMLFRLDQAG